MPTFWLDLFTGKPWQEFLAAGGTVSGFRPSRWKIVQRMQPGDKLLCYVIGVSRWIAVLEVSGHPFQDDTAIWADDVFPSRIPVRVLVSLEPETAVPVAETMPQMSFYDKDRPQVAGVYFRGSPTKLSDADGQLVESAIRSAAAEPRSRPYDLRKWARRPKTWDSSAGPVTVPDEHPDAEQESIASGQCPAATGHEAIQTLLLELGSAMGLDVWIAPNDRGRLKNWEDLARRYRVIDERPAQFDPATNRTIEYIDVLWLRKRVIEAAFEVEATTSIYSGLLRMSDLVAMQPNLNIRLYIVAPDERRERVLSEIGRPTFERLPTPLHKMCRFIGFSDLQREVEQHRGVLRYLKPDFLDEIAESAESR